MQRPCRLVDQIPPESHAQERAGVTQTVRGLEPNNLSLSFFSHKKRTTRAPHQSGLQGGSNEKKHFLQSTWHEAWHRDSEQKLCQLHLLLCLSP